MRSTIEKRCALAGEKDDEGGREAPDALVGGGVLVGVLVCWRGCGGVFWCGGPGWVSQRKTRKDVVWGSSGGGSGGVVVVFWWGALVPAGALLWWWGCAGTETVLGVLQDVQERNLRLSVAPATPTVTALSSAAAERRLWRRALHLLGGLPARGLCWDAVCQGTAIKAYQVSGHWQLAWLLLSDESLTSRISFNAAVTAGARGASWRQCLLLVLSMGQSEVRPNTVTVNAVMSGLEGTGWLRAFDLLRDASKTRHHADEIGLNTAARACTGRAWSKALELLHGMPADGLRRSRSGINAVLKACARRWERGSLLHLHRPDLVTFNTAIASLEPEGWACGLAWVAELKAERLAASLATYVSAATLLGQGTAWQHAVALLESCLLSGLEPNVALRSSLLSSSSKVLRWAAALCIFEEVDARQADDRCRAGVLPALAGRWPRALSFLANAGLRYKIPVGLLSGRYPQSRATAAAAGTCQDSWGRCLVLLGELGSRGGRDFAATTTAAIAALDKEGNWEPALALLRRANEPDEVMCTAVLSAARSSDAWPRAAALLYTMARGRLNPADASFNAAATAASSGQRWAFALHLVPFAASFGANATLAAMRRAWWRALARLAAMEDDSVLVDCISYNSLLAALASEGCWRWALSRTERMQAKSLEPDDQTLGPSFRNVLL
eukprot:s92_g3.t5